jgi:predicted ATPase/DNA-binding winged helix-turn-helix (wHTH) protein
VIRPDPSHQLFGRIEIRAAEQQLRIDGKSVRLGKRAYDVLLALVAQRHRVVSRSELLNAAWPSAAVNDNHLNVQIAALRKALGPNAVATIPGRGYRFICPEDGAEPIAPEPPSAVNPLSNLPAPLGELLGRADDLAALQAMLPEQRLITIVGAGGIGKTRLALGVASARLQAHSDGVWWVELATLVPGADADAVARAIAAAIGLSLGVGKAPAETITAALWPLNALVVLDNAEHVVAAAAALVSALERAPSLRWLVTSQVPLKLRHEQLVVLGTLSVPPGEATFEQAMSHGALALLVQRARVINHRYELDPAELAAAIAICRRLDGIALALEMAAARLAWLGADALNRRLARSPSGLGPGSRMAPTRQQTLQATFEWSHALLTPAERVVLRRLSVFVGGFTLEAAQQVAAEEQGLDKWSVLDAMFGLAEKSWVQVGHGSKPRYHLLESARVYALEQLDGAGEKNAACARHAAAMAAFSDRLMDIFWRERVDTIKAMTIPEGDNLVAAFDWSLGSGEDALAARIFVALVQAINHSRASELDAHSDVLRPRLVCESSALLASVLTAMGIAKIGFDPKASIALLREAVTLPCEGLNGPYWTYFRLSLLAQCLSMTGQPEEARAMVAQARELERPDWPKALWAMLASAEVFIGIHCGDPEAAVAPARRIIELGEAVGAVGVSLNARTNLIAAFIELKRYEEAVSMAAELSPMLTSPRYSRTRLLLLLNLMEAHTRLGTLALAGRIAKEALPLTRTCGHRGPFLDVVAELALRQGRPEATAQLIGHVQANEAAGRWHPRPDQLRDRRAVLDELAHRLSATELARWLVRSATMGDEQIDALVRDLPEAHASR